MKVVYLARGLRDYLVPLVNALSEEVDAYVLLSRADSALAAEYRAAVTCIPSGMPKVSSLRNVKYITKAVRTLRSIQPDVIHVQSGVVWESIIPSFLSGVPTVVTVHDINKHPSNSKRQIPQFLLDIAPRQARAIIVHGASLVPQAKEKFRHLDSTAIASIPHAIIDRYGYSRARVSSRTRNVLLFGGIERWKGVETLLAAEPLLRRRVDNLQIRIVGASSEPSYYQALARDCNAAQLLLERVPDAEVGRHFRWADVVVLPYHEASQSGVLQIAFSFGVPAVVSDAGALPDVVRNGENGLVVPRGDARSLADAIVRLLTNRELRARTIARIVEQRSNDYAIDTVARRTLQVYQSVLRLYHQVG